MVSEVEWLAAVADPDRLLSSRAELVDVKGTPQPIMVDDIPTLDLPLSGASVSFAGEQAQQWSATMAWAHPWMVPTTTSHPLWGAQSLRVRLWWRIWIGGAWVERAVCTLVPGDSAVTDGGTISGSTRGLDVVSLLRGGYGSPLTVSGLTVDQAVAAICERCAPTLPVRIAPTTVTVPATLTLGAQDPLRDVTELAAIGYPDGRIRSDREGVLIVGPRPEPASAPLDWQEGPSCPVTEVRWEHGIEHMGNRVTASSSHPDAAGLYVTVDDDDPSSPTYVSGPFGVRPLPGITSDKATTSGGLRSLALMALGKGRHPVDDVSVTVPQRPDLDYQTPILLARDGLGVGSLYRVQSWGPLEMPVDGKPPRPMQVGMMEMTVR